MLSRSDMIGVDLDGAVVLITGAAGFIGSHLCSRLLAGGAEVNGVARRSTPVAPGIRWWSDVPAPRVVEHLRPDVIVDLAARVTGSRDVLEVTTTFTALSNTVDLLLAAQRTGCPRVVLAGSREEPESGSIAAGGPQSPYAASKTAITLYGRMFAELYEVPVAHLRLPMVFGPAQRDLTKLVPYAVTSALSGRPIILGGGRRRFDWLHVDDVVEALVLGCAGRRRWTSAALGTGTLHSVQEVVTLVNALVPKPVELRFGGRPDREHERDWAATVTDDDLGGWQPGIDLTTGLRDTVDWYAAALRRGDLRPA